MANVDYLELLKLAFERPEESVAKLLLGSETINRATYTYPPISLNSDKDAAFRLKLESLDLHKLVQDAREEIYYAQDVGRHEVFSTFSAAHRRVVTKLVERFLDYKTVKELVAGVLAIRDRANSSLLNYALAVVCAHRPDCASLRPPRLVELFPHKYLPSSKLAQAVELANNTEKPVYLEVDSNATASSSDEENRVAYWREDVDINTHYWHLSLLYPDVENAALFGKKDRQGEFFWYIHHQIIARYNAERLSNGLARVKPVKDFRQPIAEGYFSKLDATAYGRSYPGRPANLSLARIDRPREKLNLDVSDLELYRARILEVVHRHEAYNELDEQLIRKFDPENGVNLLGNILFYAKDNSYYGNLRGSLLHALAAIHDPESRHGEELGPLADRATAMRDPAFYRVHALADELVLAYKDSLPAYSDEELRFDDVVCVGSRKGSLLKGTERHRERQIETRWSSSELDLSRGVSHAPKGSKIVASVHHLEHEDYELELQVLSVRSMATMATMRLFAAPSYDERRRRLTYDEQRKLMIELDKWVVKLDPGTNEIRRSSRLSSLTIPAENGAAADADGTPDVCQNTMEPCIYDSHDYCGSGWPRHSLLPKGNEAGFVMDFFVMITDYQLDEVLDENRCDYCSRAGMRFCARPKALYPDARPMGFPFDRRADEAHGIEYLDAFVSRYPNMWSEQITIKFANSQDV
ncbi:hypothetical protein TKK_0006492 [Trichogramma kaykai]|uniref:Tyrosinase copper-binding domain-containing protein n=1 Tax=Trichogramma kaykai TaxID=54128 RepID=A0ABD2XC05_9HYME